MMQEYAGLRLVVCAICAVLFVCAIPAHVADAQTTNASEYAEYDAALANGRTALADRVYDLAGRMFEKCIALAPNQSERRDEAMLLLLRVFHEQGRFDAVLERVTTDRGWHKATVASGSVRFWRALALHKLGRQQDALAELADMAKKQTVDKEYARRAEQLSIWCHLAAGNTDKALEGFAAFDKKYGDSPQAAANLLDWSKALIVTGRLDQAGEVLEKLGKTAADAPEAKEGHFWLGWTLVQQKKWDEAGSVLTGVATDETVRVDLRAQSFYLLSDAYTGRFATNEAIVALSNGLALASSADVKRKGTYNLGLLFFKFGRVDEGISVLKPFVTAMPGDPDSEQAQIRMAQALMEKGRFSEAVDAFQAYLETFTNDTGQASAMAGKGWGLLRLGRNAEAATAFQKAFDLHVDPAKKSECLFKIGDAYFANAQYKLAGETYSRFLREFPDSRLSSRASFQLSETMVHLEEWQNAENVLLEMAQKNEGTGIGEESLLRVAEIKDARGPRVEALAAFDKVIATYTNGACMPAALLGRGLVKYSLYMFDKALTDFERIVAEYAGSSAYEQAFYMRGFCHYWMGRDEESAAIGSEFITKFSGSQWAPDVLFWMGRNAFNQENYKLAETNFMTFVARHQDHKLADEALLRAGMSASRQKEYIRAIGLFAQLTKDYQKSVHLAEARYAQADALCELADFQPAILICEEIINRFPESEWVLPAWCRKGDCQFGMGLENPTRYEESMQSYGVVAMASTNNLNASLELVYKAEYQIGKCMEKLGRKAEAFDHYYLKVVLRYGGEQDRGIWHNEIVKSWFTRAAFDAVDLAVERQNWPSAAGVLERVVRAGVPAANAANERMRRIKSEHWWLFR